MVECCPNCEMEKSVIGFNHTLWCSSATSKDWPKEMLKPVKKFKIHKEYPSE